MIRYSCSNVSRNCCTFEKTLSMRVLEWLVSLVGSKTYGMIEFEATEPRNSLVGVHYSLAN